MLSHEVQEPSIKSVFLRAMYRVEEDSDIRNELSTATGFIVQTERGRFLLTNKHVVTGRHTETGEFLSSRGVGPNELEITLMGEPMQTKWNGFGFKLHQGEHQVWLEHANPAVDIAALPLPNDLPGSAYVYPYTLEEVPIEERLPLRTGSEVFVVGYPFGSRRAGGTAIWVRGSVASEPEIGYDNLPRYLIDARTRGGQSGSPVIVSSNGGTALFHDNVVRYTLGAKHRLVGIYSGRIANSDSPGGGSSDLGFVWSIDAIREVVELGKHLPMLSI